MRFLVDRCAGLATAVYLNAQGHDAFPAHSLPPSTPDTTLLHIAASTGRVLITSDKDFGKLIHLHHLPHAGLITLPATTAESKINLIQSTLNSHSQQIAAGHTIPPTPPTRLQSQP